MCRSEEQYMFSHPRVQEQQEKSLDLSPVSRALGRYSDQVGNTALELPFQIKSLICF